MVIHDGYAISELLAQPEFFWIADRYLDIPQEVYPRSDAEDSWYEQTLENWRERTSTNMNFADFWEIRRAARHVSRDNEDKTDLKFWLELLNQFTAESVSLELRRKAIYECVLASVMGYGSMHGLEDDLEFYMQAIDSLSSASAIEDAAAMVTLCVGVAQQHMAEVTVARVREWRSKLISRLENLLETEESAEERCVLLEVRGYLSLVIVGAGDDTEAADAAVTWWLKLTSEIEDAKLFPLERFADRLTEFAILLGEHPDYSALTTAVDALLAVRAGGFKAAEKCRDRAFRFYDARCMLRAIRELHDAKIDWFATETLRACVASMILIAEWYIECGLCYAGKHYALAAAATSLISKNDRLRDLVPTALAIAADGDYRAGS
ncbi:MAG: hypothetical protein ABIJ61_05215, partial [bacterium]